MRFRLVGMPVDPAMLAVPGLITGGLGLVAYGLVSALRGGAASGQISS
jgi:hypothetical protein